MGLIGNLLTAVFGPGRNMIRDTAEVFRENADAAGMRTTDVQTAALEAFQAEFALAHGGRFNRFMDGLNRLPRPALALSTLGLFGAAMVDPDWFVARMQGVAHVPEPLWWLMGVVVSFYFGARHQVKGQQFQRALAASLARGTAQPASSAFETRPSGLTSLPRPSSRAIDTSENQALEDWQRVTRGK